MLKSILIGLVAGFLGLAGAAATPVIVAILGAKIGASIIVGVAGYRAFRKSQKSREGVTLPAADSAGNA